MPTLLAPAPLTDAARVRTVDQIERFLTDALAHRTPDPPPPGDRPPGRPPILPALCLWAGLLVCVLHGCGSHLARWRLVTGVGRWRFPRVAVTDQALSNRLARDGAGPLARLFAPVSTVLADRLAPHAAPPLAAFATAVYALDELALDRVARLLPALRDLPAGATGLLPGKLAGLVDVRRQQWARVEHRDDPRQHEPVAARGMVAGLAAGSLLLADLGYFGVAWFDALTDAARWWVSRLRARTSFTVVHPH